MEGSSDGAANSGGTINSSGAAGSDGAAGVGDDDSQPTVTQTWSQPPDLMQRSGAPRYDAQDLARMLGVSIATLWNWEQNLGIPRPIPVRDERGGFLPRYSDRDVLAVLWLRDQLRAGASPVGAARRLFQAQRPGGPQQGGRSSGSLASAPTSGPLARGATSGGLGSPASSSTVRGVAPPTGGIGLGSATSGPLGRPGALQPPPGPGIAAMRFTSGPLTRGPATA
ncbi:MAG TPA: hypothetical protein VFU72_10290, partial [Nitrolancea sp.]|nr:hypothetical protein [Nitrolancea sp.]